MFVVLLRIVAMSMPRVMVFCARFNVAENARVGVSQTGEQVQTAAAEERNHSVYGSQSNCNSLVHCTRPAVSRSNQCKISTTCPLYDQLYVEINRCVGQINDYSSRNSPCRVLSSNLPGPEEIPKGVFTGLLQPR